MPNPTAEERIRQDLRRSLGDIKELWDRPCNLPDATFDAIVAWAESQILQGEFVGRLNDTRDTTSEATLDMVLARETSPIDPMGNRRERADLAVKEIMRLRQAEQAARESAYYGGRNAGLELAADLAAQVPEDRLPNMAYHQEASLRKKIGRAIRALKAKP